jgi:hypothetical protein
MTSNWFATYASLYRSDIVNCNNPSKPTATFASAFRYRLAKWRTIRSGVIKWADHFEVRATVKRENEITGSETRMNPAVLESCTETGADSLNYVDKVVVISNIRDMV